MAYAAYNQAPQTHFPPQHMGGYDQQGSQPPGRTLWMGELDQGMDENYIRQLYWSLGEEITCRISIDKYGGTYAFVDFTSHEGASKILATCNGTQIPNTNKYFKLNWSNRDGNGMPFMQNPGNNPNMGNNFSIFVGDLGPDVDDGILMAAFQSRYPSIRSSKVIIDPATGYSRGFGFIRFMDESEQQRSLEEMQGIYVGSRPIRVSVARPRAGLNSHTPENEISTVCARGLNHTITEEELHTFFGTIGNVLNVKITFAKDTAYIHYDQRSSAERAINELNGEHLGGAKLKLSLGRTQLNTAPSSNYHGSGGPGNAVGYGGMPQQGHPMYQMPLHHLPPAMAPHPPQPVIPLVYPKKSTDVDVQNSSFLACQESNYENWNSAVNENAK